MKNDIGLKINGFSQEALVHMPRDMLVYMLLSKDEEAKKAIELHNDEVSVLSTVCESTNFGLKVAIEEIKKLKAGKKLLPKHYQELRDEITKLKGELETKTYQVAVVESNFKYETGRLNQEVKELKEENDALLQAPVIKELADLRTELKNTKELLQAKVIDKVNLRAKLENLSKVLDTKNRYMDEMEKNLKEAHLLNK